MLVIDQRARETRENYASFLVEEEETLWGRKIFKRFSRGGPFSPINFPLQLGKLSESPLQSQASAGNLKPFHFLQETAQLCDYSSAMNLVRFNSRLHEDPRDTASRESSPRRFMETRLSAVTFVDSVTVIDTVRYIYFSTVGCSGT